MSNIISSQIDLHAKTGGVVPEVASRAHMEAIIPVINEALITANSNVESRNSKQIQNSNNINSKKVSDFVLNNSDLLQDVTHLAVTAGPGLIGSLLVGFNTAKSLAYSLDIPIIPINHIEGHIYSAFGGEGTNSKKQDIFEVTLRANKSQNSNIQSPNSYQLTPDSFPILALTVSGGHTSLTLMSDHGIYENIGQTLDDAAGEAFDKVAKLLELGYPGGPAVSRLAEQFRNRIKKQELRSEKILNSKFIIHNSTLVFPRPILNDGTFNFSFSGLKTAVLTKVKSLTANSYQLTPADKSAICCAFEDAVVDVLVTKTLRAAEKHQPKAVILAGGVAANRRLREELSYQLTATSYQLILPPAELCGDNAAMIGVAAYYHILKNDIKTWDQIKVDSNLKL